jgi:tetrahydromethanopterin S-methyltransferase subunit H
MFSFTKKQEVYNISGVNIGGQPGENPTVLFGGLFFKGEPDFSKAEKDLKIMYELSQKTGNPGIPDFFIKKEEYAENIINFIDNYLPKNYPFSVDVQDPEIKLKVISLLGDRNLLSRVIYNSIHVGITEEEREALKSHTPEMAILVAFNPKDKSPDGKIEVLENGANLLDVGLLQLAKDLGIKKILVDTAALAPGDNSGAAIASIPVVKEEYGFPSGCAIHNVVEKSKWLDSFNNSRRIVDASSNINISLFGGDFAIFGPIEQAKEVFPIMAWQDILISEYTENYFGISPTESHPRRKLLG